MYYGLSAFRQKEPILINAVNELCNGDFLKSLDRPFEAHVQDQEVTRLFGTNFDASVVNQDMLEEIPGEMFHFKARDEGDTTLLRKCIAPKHLVLKVGAKVILIKNISKDLCNGKQGIVHYLEKDTPPVINFDGNLVPLSDVKFDVYDMQQEKTLACRTQIPVILAFALTVHRAQGQTLNLVEVDCYSFIAPGRMGVAVGRATTTSGLRIINFNRKAAFTRHSDIVYDFYDREFSDFSTDLVCCQKQQVYPSVPDYQDSNVTLDTEPSTSSFDLRDMEHDHQLEEPQLQSPWDINEFIIENQSSTFMNDFLPDFC
ncbi:uncharacterized protein LOC133179211 [Saccostrea echinata]|uniref:uncharacterized protein LOC133179211 n=1 Tax=Saccostrea echinata TaxID=191078 RepID=UPI002A81EC4A|nr:uncharacterized protein LOC133179211 [Saccostrea echinata]